MFCVVRHKILDGVHVPGRPKISDKDHYTQKERKKNA